MDSRVAVEGKTSCYHCGDECPDNSIQIEEKNFCCSGCKTVYEILSENDLCAYYDLESAPGATQKKPSTALFDFLDNDSIKTDLLEYADDDFEKASFLVPNIHCSSCIWLLEHLSRINPAVVNSQVNFGKRTLSVQYKAKELTLRQVAEMLDRIGYTPVFSLDSQQEKKSPFSSFNKTLLIKMGIAGFCFGNVMLLSFPDYLGITSYEEQYQDFFRWLNVLLALPVVLYSGNEYFISAFKSLKQRFANIDVPIALGISALFFRSTYEVVAGVGSGYFDSLVGLVFFLLIGKWFQNKTYEAMSFDRDYKSYFPLATLVKVDNQFKPIPVKELKKGDEVLIRNGELLPADSILIDDSGHFDFSFVTGESDAVRKNKGQYVYAGGRLVGKQAKLIIQKTVSQSYLTELWNDQAFQNDDNQVSLVDRISQYFTIIIIAIAAISAFVWQQIDPSNTWLVFCSVLIIACPCALALSTPFTLGSIQRAFGRNRFYLKNAQVIEKLQGINRIVFDKTGTITETAQQSTVFEGDELSEEEKHLIAAAISSSTHPLSRYIKAFLSTDAGVYHIESYNEIPGKGIQSVVSGVSIQLGSAQFLNLNRDSAKEGTTVYLKIGDKYRGVFILKNQYRQGLKQLVSKLANGFKLSVLSGDNETERANLLRLFPESSSINFNQKPADKLERVRSWQNKGDQVMMLGDGLNDAGALSQAEVGIAVTEDISSFSPACDGILDAKSFGKMDKLVALAKNGRTVVKMSFVLSFIYNIGGLSFAVMGLLTPLVAAILMPLSSISVVVFTTVAINVISQKMNL